MARQHRPVRGNVYEKRVIRGSGPAPQPALPGESLTSAEARSLATRIDSTQQRYRTTAIRLIAGRACGLVVVDSRTGTEHVLTSAHDWRRLQAE